MSNPQGPKLYSATLLIRGMEGLSLGGAVLVPQKAIEDDGMAKAKNLQIRDNALTRVVLYAIVVELVVKHVWEQEFGTTAEHTHNVHKLFKQLRPETRSEIEALYDECRLAHKNYFRRAYQDVTQAGILKDGSVAEAFDVASLEEALRWNEEAMRDLKYTMKPDGPSVPAGVGWHGDSFVVPPGRLPNFAVELTGWAGRQSSTGGTAGG